MEKRKKCKKATTVMSLALVAALVLTGTFAWQSISQRAINEKVVDSNPGGRLHDDFDGENKDVYVENFTDPEEDGAPIFVRVRFQEYMETGSEAGTNRNSETRQAKSLIDGADINDVTTWKVHKPGDTDDIFHDYWNWTLGGSTVFMPTFNKNKDSLAADINGTYEGITVGDNVHFDDYKTYDAGDKKEQDAYYDADDNDKDEDISKPGCGGTIDENYTAVLETHTAKETQSSSVYTMAEWKAMGSPLGKYWVWDEDGWAYWAEPLQPGEATGLLLSKISPRVTMGDKCYYAINVVGQFASAGDWGTKAVEGEEPKAATGFYIDGITEDALALLNKAIEIKH